MKKARLSDLAVFGGQPAFSELKRVGRPNLGSRARFLERVNQALDSRHLTNDGPFVRELEERVAEFTGAKHCIAVCNATVGLEIAIRASDLSGEVIVPSFTFIATAHALSWQRIKPVFADVDPETHTLDPSSVERLIGPNTTGILAVHLWGRACNIDGLAELAGKHSLRLLFDAAHGFGSSYQNRMIGNFGTAEVFSFHATKFVNSLEGGLIATNDDDVAATARAMRNFGIVGPDQVGFEGTNGKMNEISAAMGLTSLEAIDEIIEVNKRNYRAYAEGFAGIDNVRLMSFDDQERHNYQYVVIELDQREGALSRDQLQSVLLAENVMTRRYFFPGCHRVDPYAAEESAPLPITDRLSQVVLCFPTGTGVAEQDIETICAVVRLAVSGSSQLKDLLAAHAEF